MVENDKPSWQAYFILGYSDWRQSTLWRKRDGNDETYGFLPCKRGHDGVKSAAQ